MPPFADGEPMGYAFFFRRPLTKEQVDRINQSGPFAVMPKQHSNGADSIASIEGKHYSSAEAWQVLQAWFKRRMGASR
jgi:hypothetical protein